MSAPLSQVSVLVGVSCVVRYLIGFVCRRALPDCPANGPAAVGAGADANGGPRGLGPLFGCSQLPNSGSRCELNDSSNSADAFSSGPHNAEHKQLPRTQCSLYEPLSAAVGVGFAGALVSLCAAVLVLVHRNLQLQRELKRVRHRAAAAAALTSNAPSRSRNIRSDCSESKWSPLPQCVGKRLEESPQASVESESESKS